MTISRVERLPYSAAGFGDLFVHDMVHGVPGAASFVAAGSWRDAARQIDAAACPREGVCNVLEQRAREWNAPAASLENIARLRQPATYVIATGQQAGFLGGPLYTLHKALTAVKLARKIEAEAGAGTRVVPVFWVADDDHDLAEIDHANFLQPDGTVEKIRLAFTPESQGCSACSAFVEPAQWSALRERLAAVCSQAVPLLDEYAGRSMGAAFSRLLLRWLGEFGLVVAQASDLRRFSGELLVRELNEYPETSRLTEEAGIALRERGYKPGFGRYRAAPHFFITAEPSGIRAHLDPAGDGEFCERATALAARGITPKTYSKAGLEALIAAHPERFSASAALRPVLQQKLFPVLAAVLGPGEIAYWAQLKRVHEHFGAVWPVLVPRATLTLLDAPGAKALRKCGLESRLADVFLGYDPLQRRLSASTDLHARLKARRQRILDELRGMAEDVAAVNRGLGPLFQKSEARVTHELDRIAGKTIAAEREREGAGEQRLRYLAALVRPGGAPQERELCCAQFAENPPGLPSELLGVIEPYLAEHQVVWLGS